MPEGCLADLSGTWVHELDDQFRYLATDSDAGLVLMAFRDEPIDAGKAPRRFSRSRDGGLPWLVAVPDGGGDSTTAEAGLPARAVLEFSRTTNGFVGATLAFDGGCRFPAVITACTPSLALETPLALAPDCSPLDAGWSRQHLRRTGVDAGSDTLRHEAASDGGEGDGGDERAAPAP